MGRFLEEEEVKISGPSDEEGHRDGSGRAEARTRVRVTIMQSKHCVYITFVLFIDLSITCGAHAHLSFSDYTQLPVPPNHS